MHLHFVASVFQRLQHYYWHNLTYFKIRTAAAAVLGFCVWGANWVGIFVPGAKGQLSAEGAKLRLPKARNPSRLGGLRERCKLPQRGLGRSPRNRSNFEHFKSKWSTFWDPVKLTCLNNKIEEIVSGRGFLLNRSWLHETTIMLQSHWII